MDFGIMVVGSIIIVACVLLVIVYCTSDKGPVALSQSGVVEVRPSEDFDKSTATFIAVYGDNEAQVNEVCRNFRRSGIIPIPRVFPSDKDSHLAKKFKWTVGVSSTLKDFEIIDKCDILYMIDKDGSMSKDCLTAMAYAFKTGKKIIRYRCKPPQNVSTSRGLAYDDLWLPMLGDNEND